MILQLMQCDICKTKVESDEHSGKTIVGLYQAWDGSRYSICRSCEENLFMHADPEQVKVPSQSYVGGSLTSFYG